MIVEYLFVLRPNTFLFSAICAGSVVIWTASTSASTKSIPAATTGSYSRRWCFIRFVLFLIRNNLKQDSLPLTLRGNTDHAPPPRYHDRIDLFQGWVGPGDPSPPPPKIGLVWSRLAQGGGGGYLEQVTCDPPLLQVCLVLCVCGGGGGGNLSR